MNIVRSSKSHIFCCWFFRKEKDDGMLKICQEGLYQKLQPHEDQKLKSLTKSSTTCSKMVYILSITHVKKLIPILAIFS